MKVLRSIWVFAAMLLVLVSSGHFSVGIHRCGGTIREIAILGAADGCGHADLPPCHRKMMAGCCDDDLLRYDAVDFDHLPASFLSVHAASPITLSTPTLLSLSTPSSRRYDTRYTDYDPPLPPQDRILSFGSFRI